MESTQTYGILMCRPYVTNYNELNSAYNDNALPSELSITRSVVTLKKDNFIIAEPTPQITFLTPPELISWYLKYYVSHYLIYLIQN